MEKPSVSSYANRLKDALVWWLGKKRPFIINDEYQIELLHIDRAHESVKIKITNLKTNAVQEGEVKNDE